MLLSISCRGDADGCAQAFFVPQASRHACTLSDSGVRATEESVGSCSRIDWLILNYRLALEKVHLHCWRTSRAGNQREPRSLLFQTRRAALYLAKSSSPTRDPLHSHSDKRLWRAINQREHTLSNGYNRFSIKYIYSPGPNCTAKLPQNRRKHLAEFCRFAHVLLALARRTFLCHQPSKLFGTKVQRRPVCRQPVCCSERGTKRRLFGLLTEVF